MSTHLRTRLIWDDRACNIDASVIERIGRKTIRMEG